MKINPSRLVIILGGSIISPVLAFEAPEDNSPPPAVRKQAADLPEIKLQPEAIPAPKQQAPMLGVVTGEAPELLVDHLQLQPGEGVIVRSVVPDGPAVQAGVSANDVILKVAGQAVGSPLEVSQQIAKHQPGDKITLDLIQKGKATQVDVTLTVRPQEMAIGEPKPLDRLDLEGFPEEMADRIKKAIEGNLGGLNFQFGGGNFKIPPQMEDAARQLQLQMQDALGAGGIIQPGVGGKGKIQVQAGTLVFKDASGSVEVKSNEGNKEVTIRDQEGNVTWNGPWDTAQDRAAAPVDVRGRVDRLNLDTDF